MSHKAEFIEGHLFEGTLLTYLHDVDTEKYERHALCRCDCGEEKEISIPAILRNRILSCGCYNKKLKDERDLIYKGTKPRIHVCYYGVLGRCYNINDKAYSDYGGRGITVCDEWREDINSFIKWAMTNGYEEGLTIERNDSDGNYEPSNCSFITMAEQNRNKRGTKWWYIDGVEYNSSNVAADALGITQYEVRKICEGYTSKGINFPPRKNCWSKPKY